MGDEEAPPLNAALARLIDEVDAIVELVKEGRRLPHPTQLFLAEQDRPDLPAKARVARSARVPPTFDPSRHGLPPAEGSLSDGGEWLCFEWNGDGCNKAFLDVPMVVGLSVDVYARVGDLREEARFERVEDAVAWLRQRLPAVLDAAG